MPELNWDAALQQQEINTSVQPVVSRPSFTRSEGTGVLHINMNSHDNQGILIGIPIYDLHTPYPNFIFYDVPMEVQAFWKNQKGEAGNSWRQLLSLQSYDLVDQEKINAYNELRNQFIATYQNVEMLNKTDWKSALRNSTYFGLYMWVISHTDKNGVQIVDKTNNIPHRGAQGEGRLAFVQFRGVKAFEMWTNFEKGFAAMGQTKSVFYPRIFGREGFRQSALMISYQQGADSKFSGSIQEKSFAYQDQLAGMVNNRAVNPNAYQILPEWIADAKDLRKEFINTDSENLFDDAHVWDFRRALKACNNCFDYYQAVNGDTPQGKILYDKYVAEYKYNESAQSSAQNDQAEQVQQAAGVAPGAIPPAPANAQAVVPGAVTPQPSNPVSPQPASLGVGIPQPGIPQPGVVPEAAIPQPGIPQPGVAPAVPQPGVAIPQPGVMPTTPQPGIPQPGVVPGTVPTI